MVVVVLSKEGDQVPVTPLLEVEGRLDKASPLQIGFTALKEGVIIGLTTMLMLDVTAHWPVSGVKVYVVVVVLSKEGDQVPVIPLLEVEGRLDKASPLQIGFTALKEGVIIGFTTMSMLDVTAHCPVSGVKV